ncbi:hypothetical protein C8R43DRAFT_911528 [Mycena crocata]|nr:hypothetical protein C8R43DRAFT_911528 [Mycena crocata]
MERDTIAEEVRKHTAVVSPLRRVPPELICKIFAYMLPCTRQIQGQTVPCAPWYVAHICRSWRYSAIADSFLWRFLHIASGKTPVELAQPLNSQLSRSVNAPLEVDLDFKRGSLDAETVLDLLLPHSERWRTFHLAYDDSVQPLFHLLDSAHNQLSQLHQLQLALPPRTSILPNTFSDTPNLRQYGVFSPLIQLPWSQITHYRALYHPEDHYTILPATPNLIECGIGIIGTGGENNAMIILLRLSRLYSEKSFFLAHLTAPSLRELYTEGSVVPALDFVLRSSCRLTRLVLTKTSSSQTLQTLSTILKNLPTLEFLLFEESRTRSSEAGLIELFDAMTLSGNSSDLCPNLASFMLKIWRTCITSAVPSLLTMFQSRLATCPPRLSVVRLCLPTSTNPSFRNAVTNGMQTLPGQKPDFKILLHSDWLALTTQDRP